MTNLTAEQHIDTAVKALDEAYEHARASGNPAVYDDPVLLADHRASVISCLLGAQAHATTALAMILSRVP